MHNAANHPDAIQKSFVKSIGQDFFTFVFHFIISKKHLGQNQKIIHHNNCRTCIYIFFSSYRKTTNQNTYKTYACFATRHYSQYDVALQILTKWAFPITL